MAEIWAKLTQAERDHHTHTHTKQKAEVSEKMAEIRKKRKSRINKDAFPEFLQCSCGREVKCNPHYMQKKADKLKVPVDDLIKGYQCQKCNPTKGKGKKK